MSLPIFIREEVLVAGTVFDFASGGIGQINNAPRAFNQSGIGLPSLYDQLLVAVMVDVTSSGFLTSNFDAGGFSPDVVAQYDYYNRGFDVASPAGLDGLSVTGQTAWVLNAVAADVTVGNRISMLIKIRTKNDEGADLGLIFPASIDWEGAMHTTPGNSMSYFQGKGDYAIGSVTDGWTLQVTAGTMTGVARLYGWPKN